ncbi:MAG: winged helix-turn-helix transcriptional regulator [Nanoarchaeota archaeon]|nr:winged helix-turn-helix transcriptional regulator [Nanoarchaeota archaeon]
MKESEILELKKSTSELKEAVISIAAILNKHQRGEMYFGIKNSGEVVGQKIGEDTIRDVSRGIAGHIEPRIYPQITLVQIKGRDCIHVEFSGSNIPYHAYGRAYMRMGDEDRQMSVKELESMILRKNSENIRWENEISQYKLSFVDEPALKAFIQKANESGRISFSFDNTRNILKKLHLTKEGKLLKAAEALFCNENRLEVQAAVFAGTDKVTFLDITQFNGNIFALLEKSETYIKEHINWRAEFGSLERKEIPEIPLRALREALVNSLCHRDYYAPESNKIAIFKDRVEIWNPGNFPEGHTPEDFIFKAEKSILRNPLIADILYKSKDIEKWGSGIRRIYEECAANNVKVKFKRLKYGFLVVFYRREITTPQTTPKTTPKTREVILQIIAHNSGITKEGIARALGISVDGVKYHLKRLKRQGKLLWEGSSKSGRFVAVEKKGAENVTEKVTEKVTENQIKILAEIKKDSHISAEKMSEAVGISSRKIKDNLKKLKNKGLLKRRGPDKGGYWEVVRR